MKTNRRQFIQTSALALAALKVYPASGAEPVSAPGKNTFRICFFTDAHLPYADTLARLPDAKFHHQERIRTAFDRANAFKPDAFIFGGDNVFAVDQSQDGGDKEDNARAQFENWKSVVAQKVKVPHHSVIGNHDIWYARPKGENPKALALAGYDMPNRFYSWRMNGWKFVMLDVFGVSAAPVDSEQLAWLGQELAGDEPVCVVTHAPVLSVTTSLVGGGVGNPGVLRELFYKHPNVRLALSGHNHMLDACELDRVTYVCGGAVCGAWWEGDYEHCPPAFLILDLELTGEVKHQTVLWEKA
jgi:3',5'-cyclic-AMP phosphodiesterase